MMIEIFIASLYHYQKKGRYKSEKNFDYEFYFKCDFVGFGNFASILRHS